MSAGWRAWGACRVLALRPRPALRRPRLDALWRPRAAPAFYSDQASGRPGPPLDSAERPQATGAVGETRGAETGSSSFDSPQDATQNQQSTPAEEEDVLPESPTEPAQPESEAPASSLEAEASTTLPQDSTEETPQSSQILGLSDEALEQMLYGGGRVPKSNPEGGLTPAQESVLYREGTIPPADEAETLEAAAQETETTDSDEVLSTADGALEPQRHKFGLPPRPYPSDYHLKHRYHPVLEQLSRLLMRDGKLSTAQRNLAMVMNFLRTSPAPIYSPKFPLLPGAPPASHLPLNPILYLTLAIDSVAPLLKIKYIAGAAGGGRALEMPVPLAVRQRRRTAFTWILDAVNKKPSRGSGRKQFPYRIAEEIIAVVEGRSGAWEKRRVIHKLGTTVRANIASRVMRVKGKKR